MSETAVNSFHGQRDIAFPDSLQLVVDFIALKTLFGADVAEHTVPLPLAHVERLAVPRVDEPVDVGL